MHTNNGKCSQCKNIINRYPDFDENLLEWFLALQADHPDCHVSCAGRGRVGQESAFSTGKSKAHYGESAHNCNCALDLFQLKNNGEVGYEENWFKEVVGTAVENREDLVWYGKQGSSFRELPHVEIKGWEQALLNGIVSLVE